MTRESFMSRIADPLAKAALLRAAESVFADKGLDGAKVEEITRRARLSKGAFYLHFDSKEQAFLQVLDAFFSRCSALVASPDMALPRDPQAMLDFMLDHDVETFEFLWQNRAMLRIIDGCTGAHRPLLEAFLDSSKKNAREWLRKLQGLGLCRRDVDLDVAANIVCGGYRELTLRMVSLPKKPPLREWLIDARKLLLGGLATGALRKGLEREMVVDRRRVG